MERGPKYSDETPREEQSPVPSPAEPQTTPKDRRANDEGTVVRSTTSGKKGLGSDRSDSRQNRSRKEGKNS